MARNPCEVNDRGSCNWIIPGKHYRYFTVQTTLRHPVSRYLSWNHISFGWPLVSYKKDKEEMVGTPMVRFQKEWKLFYSGYQRDHWNVFHQSSLGFNEGLKSGFVNMTEDIFVETAQWNCARVWEWIQGAGFTRLQIMRTRIAQSILSNSTFTMVMVETE